MASKRWFIDDHADDDDEPAAPGSDPEGHHHQPSDKRIRTTSTPSFASVIGEAVMVNSLKHLCMALEPVLRKVVKEEVEKSLSKRCSAACSSPSSSSYDHMQNHQPVEPPPQPASPPSGLQLVFSSKLSLPIFTGTKIVDAGGSPLQILLADIATGTRMDNKLKVEIVVLDGDFPEEDRSSTAWTSEEFGRNVVKERTGKRPLLAGDCLTFTLRDGCASLGEIEFTDNSSWIRSRKFRIGARVVRDGGRGLRVREAMTEAFIVKDHRGELYKKHHPPMLEDEVWRLEKIGKDGAFHKKLAAEGVNSVQDFLKLSVVDPLKLRKMLGAGMSDKMWEVTIKHARRCELGNKHYIYRGPSYCLTLNPICQVVNATISGQDCSNLDISGINKLYIENLVRQAYTNWHDLQEVIGIPSDVASLNQGEVMDQYPNHHDHQEQQQQQQPQQEQHHIVAKPIPLSFHHQYNLGMGGYMELGGIIQQPSHQQQINTIEQHQGNMSNNTNNNNSWHINSSSSYHPHNQQLVSNVASLEPVDEGLRHTASNPSLTDEAGRPVGYLERIHKHPGYGAHHPHHHNSSEDMELRFHL